LLSITILHASQNANSTVIPSIIPVTYQLLSLSQDFAVYVQTGRHTSHMPTDDNFYQSAILPCTLLIKETISTRVILWETMNVIVGLRPELFIFLFSGCWEEDTWWGETSC